MDSTLQDIKDRLDIVELVSSYIPVKKSGTNFKANCPFHNEKSPSLMISPQKQIWHCFGCGEGGDVFGFITRYENIEFRDALVMLAQRAGVQLPERNANYTKTKDNNAELERINNFSAKYFHKTLLSSAGVAAKEYLSQRGLTEGTINSWEIGFAQDSFDALTKALDAKQVRREDAVKAGVLVKNERGQVYDRFRNRVTFPIHNYFGNVVGFSARTMESGDVAKYINSPETDIYNKSKILFGLFFAKETIRQADEVVFVEGQMDCIQAHQAGFRNTVATSGTALTEDHLRLIGRLTKNLKFCFDSDNAGLAALRRAGELALPLGFSIKVILLEDAKDPDEQIRKSVGLWKKAVGEAVWFIEYYLKLAQDKFAFGSVEQKKYISDEVVPLIKFLSDPLEQDHYVRFIGEHFAVSEQAVRSFLKGKVDVKTSNPTHSVSPKSPESTQEKEILGGIMVYPEYLNFVKEEGLPTGLLSSDIAPLINGSLTGDLSTVNESTLAKEAVFMIESSLENLANNELALIRELKKTFYLFKLAGIKKQLQDTTTAIKKAESQNDTAETARLNKSFAQLSVERYNLEQKLQG